MKNVVCQCDLCGTKSKNYMEIYTEEFGSLNINLKTGIMRSEHIYKKDICFDCADKIAFAIKEKMKILKGQHHE